MHNIIGNNIHNIAIVPSEIPLISSEKFRLPANRSFLISMFDLMGARIRKTLNVFLSKFVKFALHGALCWYTANNANLEIFVVKIFS